MPLASAPLFRNVGIAGGISILGGCSLVMCFLPLLFLWKGERLRAGSKFCIALKQRKEEMAKRVAEQRQRQEAARGSKSSGMVMNSKEEAV